MNAPAFVLLLMFGQYGGVQSMPVDTLADCLVATELVFQRHSGDLFAVCYDVKQARAVNERWRGPPKHD